MSTFLDEINPLRLYKTKFYYPIDEKDRFHNSIVYIMSPNIQSSINVMNHKLNIKGLFKSYFVEKNIQFIINGVNESGLTTEEQQYLELSESMSMDPGDKVILTEDYLYAGDIHDNIRIMFPDSVDEILNEETTKTKFGVYNFNNIFKTMLFNERIKTQKECFLIYDKIKENVRDISFTYADLKLYKNKNMFYDWSYYTETFFKNNKFVSDKGLDVFFTFMNRFITDKRFSSYKKRTIVIPVSDWVTEENRSYIWDHKKSINPISLMWRMMRIDPSRFEIWKDYNVLFLSDMAYCSIDFGKMDYNRDVSRFRTVVNNLITNNIVEVEEVMDSKKAIVHHLIDNLSLNGNIDITNLSGGTSTRTKEDLEKSGLLDTPNDDIDVKKAAMVNKLEKIADKSLNIKDAENKLASPDNKEDEEWIKNVLLDLQAENVPQMNAARINRMNQTKENILKKVIDGKPIKDIIYSKQYSIDITPTSVPIDHIDESWKELKFANFNKTYNMNSDIMLVFIHFSNITHPMNILDINSEDTSTSEDYKRTYTVSYEDAETGKRSKIIIDVPNLINNRFMKLRGNEKVLIGQLMLLPVVKTDEDTVQIVSNYNKIFVRRKSPGGFTKSSAIVNKLYKALTKYTGKQLKVDYGDNRKVCSKYEVPTEFIDLGSVVSKITFPKTDVEISFNMDYIRKHPIDKSVLPEKFKKLSDEDINNKFLSCVIKNGKAIPIVEEEPVDAHILRTIEEYAPDFIDLYNSSSVAKRLMYSEASILTTTMPIILVLSYSIGLQKVLERIGIKYNMQEKRPKKGEIFIKFKDGYLSYEPRSSSDNMLLNGLMECDLDQYSIKDINTKALWMDVLDDFGGRIKADGLDNFYDLMIDPITKEVCDYINIPNNYIDCLIYANDLLSDNKYNKHYDITGNRMRTNELIVGHLYQVLAKEYGNYRNTVKRNKGQVSFTIKRSALIDSILTHDQTSSDLSTLSPVLEAEAANKFTFKGLSGMNSERAFSMDKRAYDKSMLGILSLSTGFANTVGINRQATIDANVINARGFIKPVDPKELNTTRAFSVMEGLSPMAINHDDPIRTAMAFTQTSQHQMIVKKTTPNLITTGMDLALPYMSSEKYSYKCRFNNAVVREITDDYIIIQNASNNKEKEFIDIREIIRKNSDGGFYIVTKLTPCVTKGQKLKENDIIAYDKHCFSTAAGADNNKQIGYNVGTLAKVAILTTDLGYEDSCVVDATLSEALATDICAQKDVSLSKKTNVYNLVHKGQEVQEGDPLLVFQEVFDDDDANELLGSISTDNGDDISDLGRKQVHAKLSGVIQDIKVFRTCEISELSPSLKKIVQDYEKGINKLKSVMKANDINKQYILEPSYKLDQTGKLKGLDGVRIEIYIKVHDKFGIGDKLVFSQGVKGVNSYIIPSGEEAYTDYRKEEHINAFLSLGSILGRMTPSLLMQGYANKSIIELNRQCKELLEIDWKPLQDILLEED